MNMRPGGALIPAVILLGLIASCSSSSTSASTGPTAPASSPGTSSSATASPTGAAALRSADARPLIVQCVLSRGLLKPPTGDNTWLHGTKVLITAADSSSFNEWWAVNNAAVVDGRQLLDWAQSAATDDKLPPQICGSVTASQLQRQVFAQFPGAGNPWG
jgi:hypothetical protein